MFRRAFVVMVASLALSACGDNTPPAGGEKPPAKPLGSSGATKPSDLASYALASPELIGTIELPEGEVSDGSIEIIPHPDDNGDVRNFTVIASKADRTNNSLVNPGAAGGITWTPGGHLPQVPFNPDKPGSTPPPPSGPPEPGLEPRPAPGPKPQEPTNGDFVGEALIIDQVRGNSGKLTSLRLYRSEAILKIQDRSVVNADFKMKKGMLESPGGSIVALAAARGQQAAMGKALKAGATWALKEVVKGYLDEKGKQLATPDPKPSETPAKPDKPEPGPSPAPSRPPHDPEGRFDPNDDSYRVTVTREDFMSSASPLGHESLRLKFSERNNALQITRIEALTATRDGKLDLRDISRKDLHELGRLGTPGIERTH